MELDNKIRVLVDNACSHLYSHLISRSVFLYILSSDVVALVFIVPPVL